MGGGDAISIMFMKDLEDVCHVFICMPICICTMEGCDAIIKHWQHMDEGSAKECHSFLFDFEKEHCAAFSVAYGVDRIIIFLNKKMHMSTRQ